MPVPMEAMRRGRESEDPAVVTRTGRIAWTPSPGNNFIARKSNPSLMYALITGKTAAGMLNLFCISQLLRALESPPATAPLRRAHVLLLEHRHGALGRGVVGGCQGSGGNGIAQPAGNGQFCGGGVICVAVTASIESNSTSALRPTVTVPWIGRTQAKDAREPESQSDRKASIASAIPRAACVRR